MQKTAVKQITYMEQVQQDPGQRKTHVLCGITACHNKAQLDETDIITKKDQDGGQRHVSKIKQHIWKQRLYVQGIDHHPPCFSKDQVKQKPKGQPQSKAATPGPVDQKNKLRDQKLKRKLYVVALQKCIQHFKIPHPYIPRTLWKTASSDVWKEAVRSSLPA